MNLLGVTTGATCGFACWEAREDICRCSCGGANHGCLRKADGVQPQRTSRIDGVMRKLTAVGAYRAVHDEAYALNLASGETFIYADSSRERCFANLPARIRWATKAQVDRWPELTAYRAIRERPYLLWQLQQTLQGGAQ